MIYLENQLIIKRNLRDESNSSFLIRSSYNNVLVSLLDDLIFIIVEINNLLVQMVRNGDCNLSKVKHRSILKLDYIWLFPYDLVFSYINFI